MWPQGHRLQTAGMPRMPRAPARAYRETVLRVKEAFPELCGRNRRRGRQVCGEYYVISIESEDTNMSIRGKSILITLAITLIGTAPAWSQGLLKTLDPD